MKNMEMKTNTRTCVVYIACRLISGRKIAKLHNITQPHEIDMSLLADADGLLLFDERLGNYVPGFASGCRYEFTRYNGQKLEFFITRDTFVVHLTGSSTYFVGNLYGDNIYLYDHEESAHIKYRILDCKNSWQETRSHNNTIFSQ